MIRTYGFHYNMIGAGVVVIAMFIQSAEASITLRRDPKLGDKTTSAARVKPINLCSAYQRQKSARAREQAIISVTK